MACRTLDGAAFILLDSRLLRLNEVGTFVWERLEHGAELEAVVEAIVARFDTTRTRARTDTRAFVRQLVARDALLRLASRPGGRLP